MKTWLAIAGAILVLVGTPVAAHRMDEYLQATTISLEKDHIQAEIRLTPGIAVLFVVLPHIDTDANGVISESEQRAYARSVLDDLSLTVDDQPMRLRLVSFKFPQIEAIKEGLGEIQLELNAEVPRGGASRKLIFENRHQRQIAAYLVNALVPRDSHIRITAQDRNYQQSSYQLNYVQADDRSDALSFSSGSVVRGVLGTSALALLAWPVLLWRRRVRTAAEQSADTTTRARIAPGAGKSGSAA